MGERQMKSAKSVFLCFLLLGLVLAGYAVWKNGRGQRPGEFVGIPSGEKKVPEKETITEKGETAALAPQEQRKAIDPEKMKSLLSDLDSADPGVRVRGCLAAMVERRHVAILYYFQESWRCSSVASVPPAVHF
jgi:hypothetical protein